jgi:hypothetical protein
VIDAGGHRVAPGGLDRRGVKVSSDDAPRTEFRLAAFFVLFKGLGSKLLPGSIVHKVC